MLRLTLVPLLGTVLLAAVVLLAGGGGPTAFERVAAHPDRFRSQRMTVTGRVRRITAPPASAGAFLLVGPHGCRSRRPAPLAPAGGRDNEARSVRGAVIPVRPYAESRAAARDRVVTLGELASRVRARILETEHVGPA